MPCEIYFRGQHNLQLSPSHAQAHHEVLPAGASQFEPLAEMADLLLVRHFRYDLVRLPPRDGGSICVWVRRLWIATRNPTPRDRSAGSSVERTKHLAAGARVQHGKNTGQDYPAPRQTSRYLFQIMISLSRFGHSAQISSRHPFGTMSVAGDRDEGSRSTSACQG
jgi:hypothetical protein